MSLRYILRKQIYNVGQNQSKTRKATKTRKGCIKNEAFRAEKVNFVFAVNAELNSLSEEDINKQGGIKATLSSLVGAAGFEPATSRSQTWRDNRATLRPEHPFLAGGKSKQLTLNLKTSFKPGYQWKRTATRRGPDLNPRCRATPPDEFLPLP